MPPMGTNFGSEEGYATERTRGYYEAGAGGGAGLIQVCEKVWWAKPSDPSPQSYLWGGRESSVGRAAVPYP
jgi:2,4-dienoyl-CoA reductase-like NADH-dependent reductase (Old Yellow Enzyme family)